MPTEKTIGVIAAMASEIAALKAKITNPVSETISGVEFVSGRLGETSIVAAQSGVGKVFAALCTQTMILRFQPAMIVNIGVGGSLTPKLNIADVCVASAAVEHDMDTTAFGDPPGFIWGIGQVELPCDQRIVSAFERAAKRLGVHTETGVIASGDTFVSDAETKARLHKTFSALACEMEGGAVAHVCYVNQLPFGILRAVSDNGDENAEQSYTDALERAAAVALAVAEEALKEL